MNLQICANNSVNALPKSPTGIKGLDEISGNRALFILKTRLWLIPSRFTSCGCPTGVSV